METYCVSYKKHTVNENSSFREKLNKTDYCFYKLQHFSNDAFQSYFDLFQVNWLV